MTGDAQRCSRAPFSGRPPARGDTITLIGIEEAEVLLFDLAAT
jgi:hypothetical protein